MTCETTMVNYQFMTKSQTIVFDEWMVPHTQAVSGYEEYPDVLKTTVCPSCLTASNEYSFGVDEYKYFFRNPRKNDLIKEFFTKTIDERFKLLAGEFAKYERDSAKLDRKNKRPVNTRTRATFEKIWENREQYGVPFFTLMLQEPRDYVTALVCFGLDRYCQMVRIAFDNDIDPENWDYASLKASIEDHFADFTLDIKAADPRFYYIGMNYLQSVQFLEDLTEIAGNEKHHQETQDEFFEEAYKVLQLSLNNDDMSAIPCELKEGGMNLLMAKLHFAFENEEPGKKCLRMAKIYADRLTRISSQNQQNYVNEVDDLYKQYFESENEGEEEEKTAQT
ncbi:hypothetical protein GF373_12905 [bacterium]|nr:hypothetical protein [bacterium]